MDEKKTKDKTITEETVEETVEETAEDIGAEKPVKIRLPKTMDEKAPVPVWVNDRSWLIERGVTVEVPECVAEVLRHREEMLEECLAYDEANERK